MFYDKQPVKNKENYKNMLLIVGKLTLLFSESDCPYLPYRVHENVFCKYFEADNLSRSDCSADAKKGKIGIGLKTWMGNSDQKVAEFGKLRPEYEFLTGLELVKQIATYRNERIRITKNLHGIDKMIYHIVRRVPENMEILESTFDSINIENIEVISGRGNANNTYFADGKHTYHFSKSKNTLYMLFDDLEVLDSISVSIMDDPYTYLQKGKNDDVLEEIEESSAFNQEFDFPLEERKEQICLRLYSTEKDGTKVVHSKSGLNIWNAAGRKRNANEVYIPYPAEDRRRTEEFFPPREQPFDLKLPDGSIISAKVCQENGKAIMSNPNKVLGEWLLRKVFELEEGTVVTYNMLEVFGVDCVIFTKEYGKKYSVDFAETGTYEEFINADKE